MNLIYKLICTCIIGIIITVLVYQISIVVYGDTDLTYQDRLSMLLYSGFIVTFIGYKLVNLIYTIIRFLARPLIKKSKSPQQS